MADNEEVTEVIEETPTTQPEAVKVVEHVHEAAESAASVAQSSGAEGWQVIADELKGLRADLKKMVKASKPEAEPTAVAPDVEVEAPTPPVRYVRRNGRKVKKR
jgi:hypothetical protein